MRFPFVVCVFVCFAVMTIPSFGQSPNGNINGLVSDPTNAAVSEADIVAVNDVTGMQYTTKTNSEGIYLLPNLPPGPYRVQVSKIGFKTLIKPDIVLNVQDSLSINFTLLVGAFHEIVTVEGGASMINTTDASVSTVVDQTFVNNMPLNGRSFQTLINLSPGVVAIPSNPFNGGQFSINGQRGSSNYWMVDGVSVNIGIGATGSGTGNGLGGALGSFSAMGGTNSLVSVDSMEEFRIQTSTYAPEFGRTPGGQISIVTRSGTNQFHGTAYDYFRNDVLDANNWFNGYTNNPPLPKAKERQNDFGGTIGGPIVRDRTFFFFSYEGLRLRLPQTALSTVPDVAARQSAVPAMQPYLNAFPSPNGPEDPANPGAAQFNASFSNPATLDAYSLRIDQRLGKSLNLFGRYNYSPSEVAQRGTSGNSLNTVSTTRITTQTATVGATWSLSPTLASDLRFNYSRTSADLFSNLDSFGGAVPPVSLPLPSPFTPNNSSFYVLIESLQGGLLNLGQGAQNLQRQINIVANASIQIKSHAIKVGIDFRRLSPQFTAGQYELFAGMLDVPSAQMASLQFATVASGSTPTFHLRNIGIYAEDTWKVIPHLTITYGLRWDFDLVPSSNPALPAVVGFNLNNLSGLALAPAGTEVYRTTYGNVAPRVGVAYQLSENQNWQTVLRGGFGLFYDLASSELGNNVAGFFYPFGNNTTTFGGTFPPSPAQLAPPPIAPPNASK